MAMARTPVVGRRLTRRRSYCKWTVHTPRCTLPAVAMLHKEVSGKPWPLCAGHADLIYRWRSADHEDRLTLVATL